MSDQVVNAVVALGLGAVASVLLFLPLAAVEYRRDGNLRPRELGTLVGGAVYGFSLWTYTLLPLPPEGEYRCRVPQTELLGTIGRVDWVGAGVRAFLRDEAVQQVLLNVVLFVPLGVLLRLLLRRGVVVAGLAGLAVSLLVETTQRTGDWGLYACAYRRFDVDDLLVNTLGALVGSLLARPLLRRREGTAAPLPTRVTWGRRMVGMASDAVFVLLVGGFVAGAWRAAVVVLDTAPHRAEQWVLQWTVPFALEALCVLALGRTVGEWVVDLRTEPAAGRAARRGGVLPARLLKLAAGLGPVYLLVLLPVPGRTWWLAAYLLLTVAATVRTREHRGLSHVVAGLRLRVDLPE